MSDGGWWEGELSGRKGMFPDNFVKVVDKNNKEKKNKDDIPVQASKRTSVKLLADKIKDIVQDGPGQTSGKKKDPVIPKKRAKILFSYEPENEDELKLELGDIVDVIKQVEDGWYEGSVNGKTGVFPSNFVELLSEENEQEEEDKSLIKGKKIIGVGLGNIFGSGPIKLRSTGASTKQVSDDKPSENKDTKPPNEEAVLRRPKTDATPSTAFCDFNHASTNPLLNVMETIGEDVSDSSAEEYEKQIANLKIKSHDNMKKAKTEGKLVSEALSKLTASLNRELLYDVDSVKEQDLIEYIDEVPASEEFDESIESLTSYYTPRLTNVLSSYYRGTEGITANNSAIMQKVEEHNEQSFYTPNSSSTSITYGQIPEQVNIDLCIDQSCSSPEPENSIPCILHGEGLGETGFSDEKKSMSEPAGVLYRRSLLLEKLRGLNILGQKSNTISKPERKSKKNHNPTFSTPKASMQLPSVSQVVDSIAVTKKRWSEAHRESFDTQEVTENVHFPSNVTCSESPQDKMHHIINPQNLELRCRSSEEEHIGLQQSDTYFSTLNEKGYLSPFIKNIVKKYKLTDLYKNCLDQTCSIENVKVDLTDIDRIYSTDYNTEDDEPYSSSFFQDDDEAELNVFEEPITFMNNGNNENIEVQKIGYNKFEHDVAELMNDILRRSQERISQLDNQYPTDMQVCNESTEDMSLSNRSEYGLHLLDSIFDEDSIRTINIGAEMNYSFDEEQKDNEIGPWVSPAVLGKVSSKTLEMDRITSTSSGVPVINGELNKCSQYTVSESALPCSKSRKQPSFCRIPFGSSENCNWFSKHCEETPSECLVKIGRVPNVPLLENKNDLASELLKRDFPFRSHVGLVTDYKEVPRSLPADVSVKHSQYFIGNSIPCHKDIIPVGTVVEETKAAIASYSDRSRSSFCRIPFLPQKDDSCSYSRSLFESPTKDASLQCKHQNCENREDRIPHEIKQTPSENLERIYHIRILNSDNPREQQSSGCSTSSSKLDLDTINTSASEILWPFHASHSSDEEAHDITSLAANSTLVLIPGEDKKKTPCIDWASFLFGNSKNLVHPGDGDNRNATSSAKQKRSKNDYENSRKKIHLKSSGMKSISCTWTSDRGVATTASSSGSSKSEGSMCNEKKLEMILKNEVAGLYLKERKKHSFWKKLFAKQYSEPVKLLSYHSECKNLTVKTSFQTNSEMKTQSGQYCNDSNLSDSFSPSSPCIVDKLDYVVNLEESPRFIYAEKKSKINEPGERGSFDLTGQASERSLISETRLLYEIPDDLDTSIQVVPENDNSADSFVHCLHYDDTNFQELSETTSLEETQPNSSFFDTDVENDIKDIIVTNEHEKRCHSLYEYFSELNKYDWVSEKNSNGLQAVDTRDLHVQESMKTVCETDRSQNAIGDIPIEKREQAIEQQYALQETVNQNMAQNPSSEMLADENYTTSISTTEEDSTEVDVDYPSPDPGTLLQDLDGINFTETPHYGITDADESQEMRMFLQQALQPIDHCFSDCFSFSSNNSTPLKPPENQLCMGVDKTELDQAGAESLATHDTFSINGLQSSLQYSDDMQRDLSELDTMEILTEDERLNLNTFRGLKSPNYRYLETVESELDRLEISSSGNVSFDSRDFNNSADVSKMTYLDIPRINESLESTEFCVDVKCSGDTITGMNYFPSNSFIGNISLSDSEKSMQYVTDRMNAFQGILKRFSMDDSLMLSSGKTSEGSFQSHGSPAPVSSNKESSSISSFTLYPKTDFHSQETQMENPFLTCIEDHSFNNSSTPKEQSYSSSQNLIHNGNSEIYKLHQSLNKSCTEVSDES